MLAALAYVLLLAIVALGVPLASNLGARVSAEVRTQAQGQADLVAATAADLLGPEQRRALGTLATTAGRSLRGRILIVDDDGTVLVDSAGPAEIGSSYRNRPEIAAALGGRQLQVQRASKTLGQQILATAVPVVRNGHAVGAVRVTQSITAVHNAVRRAVLGLGLIGLIVLALGLSAGAVIAAQVSRPITRLEAVARRVAQGDLSARADVEGSREQRSLARSFNEMTDRITRLLAAQREFVADASHQLRTPLTGLRLRLEETKALSGQTRAGSEVDGAMAEVDRLAHTVNELLVLSAGGEHGTSGTWLDLGEIASAACDRWARAARDRAIRLSHRQVEPGEPVWAVRADVERALDCLIENAINYSPGGAPVELISAAERIEVRDRGPGLSADEREAVFERFHRGRAGLGGAAGSGLGLSIARELARGWGGNVTLLDREGGGLVAILALAGVPDTGGEGSGLPALNPETTTLS